MPQIIDIFRVIEERRFTERLLMQFAPAIVRNLRGPNIGEILGGSTTHWTAEDLLDSVLPGWNKDYVNEFAELSHEIAERYASAKLTMPLDFRVLDGAGIVLYVWIRHRRPRRILETGIANGHSTAILLNAVVRNGSGEVHSVDISPNVGGLLTASERRVANLHCLPRVGAKRAFARLVSSLTPLDVFFHDSRHSYRWQTFEYESAWEHMSADGLLGSDDVDKNFSFSDFGQLHGCRPHILIEESKVSGFINRSKASAPAVCSTEQNYMRVDTK